MSIGTVWSDCWQDCWTDCWADAVIPPIATLVLGAISIRPALSGAARTGPLLQGTISTDRSDQ